MRIVFCGKLLVGECACSQKLCSCQDSDRYFCTVPHRCHKMKNMLQLNGKKQQDPDSLLNCTQLSHSCHMFLNEGYLCSPRNFNSLFTCTNSAKKVWLLFIAFYYYSRTQQLNCSSELMLTFYY